METGRIACYYVCHWVYRLCGAHCAYIEHAYPKGFRISKDQKRSLGVVSADAAGAIELPLASRTVVFLTPSHFNVWFTNCYAVSGNFIRTRYNIDELTGKRTHEQLQ